MALIEVLQRCGDGLAQLDAQFDRFNEASDARFKT